MTKQNRFRIGGGLVAVGGLFAAGHLLLGLPVGWLGVGVLAAFVGALIALTEFTKASLALVGVVLLAGCGVASAGRPDWFKQSEKESDQIATAARHAVPYPLQDVKDGGFLERRNQSEKLKRFSDANKVGYVYVLSFGKFIGYYAIKGKISAVNSSMTNVNQTWDCGSDCTTVVDSIGDDGTFGPNEGGDRGVFFFTTDGTMVETSADFLYSDQRLQVDVPNLLK